MKTVRWCLTFDAVFVLLSKNYKNNSREFVTSHRDAEMTQLNLYTQMFAR